MSIPVINYVARSKIGHHKILCYSFLSNLFPFIDYFIGLLLNKQKTNTSMGQSFWDSVFVGRK